MFTMECLNAKEGDCIIFHFGSPALRRLAIVDSGSSGTYKQVLKKRLEELKVEISPSAPLYFELGMVSHIDNDHLKGFLDFFKREKAGKNFETDLLEFGKFWHNSFHHLTRHVSVATAGSITASSSVDLKQHLETLDDRDGRMDLILSSFAQGDRLEQHLHRWKIASNAPHHGTVSTAWNDVHLDGGVAITITGPHAKRLKELGDKWPEPDKKIETAAYLDKSVSNLSSITAVVRCEGASVFLTGDARGDDLVEGLEEKNLLNNGKAHFTVLKMPHHGSDRNMTQEFLENITADIYVFSANGKHDNPDAGTLKMLAAARPGATFTLAFTNPISAIKTKFHSGVSAPFDAALKEIKQDCTVTLVERDEAELSVNLELGN